jgi:hypothetical protein
VVLHVPELAANHVSRHRLRDVSGLLEPGVHEPNLVAAFGEPRDGELPLAIREELLVRADDADAHAGQGDADAVHHDPLHTPGLRTLTEAPPSGLPRLQHQSARLMESGDERAALTLEVRLRRHDRHADPPLGDDPRTVGHPLEIDAPPDLGRRHLRVEVLVLELEPPELRRLRVEPERAGDVRYALPLPRGLEAEPDEPAFPATRHPEAVRVEKRIGQQDRGIGCVVHEVAAVALDEAVLRQILSGPALERGRHVPLPLLLVLVQDHAVAIEGAVVAHGLVPIRTPLIGERRRGEGLSGLVPDLGDEETLTTWAHTAPARLELDLEPLQLDRARLHPELFGDRGPLRDLEEAGLGRRHADHLDPDPIRARRNAHEEGPATLVGESVPDHPAFGIDEVREGAEAGSHRLPFDDADQDRLPTDGGGCGQRQRHDERKNERSENGAGHGSGIGSNRVLDMVRTPGEPVPLDGRSGWSFPPVKPNGSARHPT